MSTKNKGLIGLGYLHNGMKQLSASTPLRVPADAKNKKFRIMSSDVLAAQFEAVEAMPLKKPFSEVFTLLQIEKRFFRKEFAEVNIGRLEVFEEGTIVTPDVLVKRGIVKQVRDGVKILGKGDLTKALTDLGR